MSPQDAVHAVCHEYPGGVEALAPRIGRGAQVLRNKVGLDQVAPGSRRTHEATLADVSAINRATGDLRVLQALAAEVGAVVMRLPDVPVCDDAALLELVLSCNREWGEVAAEISSALADGQITPREYDRINRETLESVSRQLELLERLRGLVVDRPEVVSLATRKRDGGRRA